MVHKSKSDRAPSRTASTGFRARRISEWYFALLQQFIGRHPHITCRALGLYYSWNIIPIANRPLERLGRTAAMSHSRTNTKPWCFSGKATGTRQLYKLVHLPCNSNNKRVGCRSMYACAVLSRRRGRHFCPQVSLVDTIACQSSTIQRHDSVGTITYILVQEGVRYTRSDRCSAWCERERKKIHCERVPVFASQRQAQARPATQVSTAVNYASARS